MHVCFFAHKSKKNSNGATLSLFNIANEMTKRGIRVTIIIPNKSVEYTINNKDIEMIYIPAYSMRTRKEDNSRINKLKEIIKILYNKVAIRRALKKVKDKKPDIIHINGIDSEIGAVVSEKLSIPYVWHIRQLLEEDLNVRLHNKKKIYKMLEKSDSIIAISKVVKNKFEKIVNRDLELIYNGIPLEKYQIEERKPLFSGEKINILLAGRIVEQKGQFEAVKAVEYLIRNKGINNINLKIVGDIQDSLYATKIKRYIFDNELSESITITNHMSDLRDLRKICDIGLVCSENEAFGRVTIETMASRMLVIGANTGGTTEIIKDNVNGILYDQGSYLSLANKIEYAIKNKDEMNKLAEEGYFTAIDKYSISNVVDEITKIYDYILSNKH